MFSVSKIMIDGGILSLLALLHIGITMHLNPRIWLWDYPEDIQDKVPPQTQEGMKLSWMLGLPFLVLAAAHFASSLTLKHENSGDVSFFLLFLNAFGVASVLNLVD